MRLRNLEITVFFAGAIVMSMELCGSRLLAPFLGSSIFVWTSLIGVILGSLSIGYWWGGKLADRRPEPRLLGIILLAAAGLVALVALMEYPLLNALGQSTLDVRLAAVLAALVLFTAPSILLGAVSPFAIRLRMTDVEHSGSIAGRLYALSTVGSIFGTFITGFYLFAWIGSGTLILVLSATLCCLSLLVWWEDQLQYRLLLLGLLVFLAYAQRGLMTAFEEGGLRSFDTRYHRALILDTEEDGRKRRVLVTDPLGSQSAMYLDNPEELAGPYYAFYDLAVRTAETPKQVLLLGGGAYSYPKHFLRLFPDTQLTVVELDPGLTEIAKNFFFLQESPLLSIVHEDARTFLNRSEQQFEVILVDVFRSSPEMPFYLATQEAFAEMYRMLPEGGILCVNLIAGLKGESSKMLRALTATIETLFDKVYLLPVRNADREDRSQNIILLARKGGGAIDWQSASPEDQNLLAGMLKEPLPSDLPLLTDDFAPVERYMLPVLTSMNAAKGDSATQ